MTRKEMFDLRIASDGFRYAVRKALFECSKFPPCTERMIVEGRLAEALYFSERMMEKTYKDLETEEKTNVAEISDAAKWLAVGAAIVAAIIVTGQTYPLCFFLIPMIC